MASTQPVTVTYLKLPPEEQLFFGLKEIFETIKDKLEILTYAIAATQEADDPEPIPIEVEEVLLPLRRQARSQCSKIIRDIQHMHQYSTAIIKLLNVLPISATEEKVPDIVKSISSFAGITAEHWEDGEKGMRKLSEEILSTFGKVQAVMENDKRRTVADTVFTQANSDVVNELLDVAKEGCNVHREVIEYLRNNKRQLLDENLRRHPILANEVEMMRQRWTEFSESVAKLRPGLFGSLLEALESGPGIEAARNRGDLWRILGGKNLNAPSRKTDPSLAPRAILEAPTATAVSVPAPSAGTLTSSPSSGSQTSFFWKLWRQLCSGFPRFCKATN